MTDESRRESRLPEFVSMQSDEQMACRNTIIHKNVFIFGAGNIAVACAEILIALRHRIVGVVAFDESFENWAVSNDVFLYKNIGEISTAGSLATIDWIFSIANPTILPDEIVNRACGGAYNYHDAPLPLFAGSHATSWAIIEGQRRYGVTWHKIDRLVDSGDIAIQSEFLISAEETALSLNLKCFNDAIKSFEALVSGLSSQNLVFKRQNLNARTYFALNKRPTAGGVVSFDCHASKLVCLANALDFGKLHFNPLAIPKLILKNGLILISSIMRSHIKSTAPAGAVVAIYSEGWRIATNDYDVIIGGLICPADLNANSRQIAGICSVHVGYQLPILSQEARDSITGCYENSCRHEPFWRQLIGKAFSSVSHKNFGTADRWRFGAWKNVKSPTELPTAELCSVLLSSFALMLWVYSGKNDILLGWVSRHEFFLSGRMLIRFIRGSFLLHSIWRNTRHLAILAITLKLLQKNSIAGCLSQLI